MLSRFSCHTDYETGRERKEDNETIEKEKEGEKKEWEGIKEETGEGKR
jgi:hypothetical protein